jgi:hypothetical protein
VAVNRHGLAQFPEILTCQACPRQWQNYRVLPLYMPAITFEEASQHIADHVRILKLLAFAKAFKAFQQLACEVLIGSMLKRQTGENVVNIIGGQSPLFDQWEQAELFNPAAKVGFLSRSNDRRPGAAFRELTATSRSDRWSRKRRGAGPKPCRRRCTTLGAIRVRGWVSLLS